MNAVIVSVRSTRQFLLDGTRDLTIEQWNRIPAGFNNNIIWNMGHLVAALEGLCYRRSGLPMPSGEAFFERYRPGSKPEHQADSVEIEQVRALLQTSLDRLEADLNAGIFSSRNYEGFTTRYGVELNSAGAAVSFLPFHEGLHMGFINALKKIVA